MNHTVTVIGDGGWGTALATVLQHNGHKVTVWGPFEETLNSVRETHANQIYLPGIPISPDIAWTADAEAAASGADTIVIAVPTQYYADVLQRFAGNIAPEAAVVSVTKGLDRDTHQVMSRTAEQILNIAPIAALSGPSHAEEVAREIPTAVVIASEDAAQAERLQRTFTTPRFRVYTASDVDGVQLGGAMKNVIAIAVGISDGLGFGDNTRAALITRGLAEITRLGTTLGSHPATFSGLSGIGDLIVTCTSHHSRNRAVGERLGRGETLDDIQRSMKQVAEGVWNCGNALALAQKQNIEVPITQAVCDILHNDKAPMQAVEELMTRDLKPEYHPTSAAHNGSFHKSHSTSVEASIPFSASDS